MSESTTAAPAAPASTPAPAAPPESSSPPAASQPPISISDAARLLSRQRRQGAEPAGAAPPGTAPAAARPSPNDAARATAAKTAEAPSPAAPAASAPATGLSAMEKALGVPGTEAPPGAAQAPPAADPTTGVEIDGRRYSPAELRENVLKAADYTRKTQELAQQRQALEAQQHALATVLPYIQPELARLAETVQNAPPRPDPRLLEVDPNRYHRERAAWESAMEEQNRLASLTTLQQQAAARAMEQQVAAANEQLSREFPFWADAKQRLEAQQQIVEWATTKGGYSRDELRGLTNPHHLKTMMKASMFDRWVEGAKTSAPPTTMAAPARGTPPPPAPTQQVQVAQERFDAKPDFRSGAQLLAARRAAASNGHAR